MIPDNYMDTLKLERLKKEQKTKKRSIITKRRIVTDYLNNPDTRSDFIKWSEKKYPEIIISLYDLLIEFKALENDVYQRYPDNKLKRHKKRLYHLPSISQ